MGKVTLWVDGTQIQAEEGTSVLHAALDAGIYIPHICSHPDLEAQGGCKLCVVEIEGMEGPVCSCMTYVKEGLKVRTKGEPLDAIRRTSMQVMMASHPQCTGCRSFGNCEFQALQQYLSSVNHPGMREFHKETVNLNTNNPLIDRDMVRCIQCGRCVRVCADVRGVNVLQYNRVSETGETYVGTLNDFSLVESDCRFCGACVEVCPTGALQDREGIFQKDKGTREEYLIPCSLECPAHTDIPAYLRLIAEGKNSEAVAVIREKLPFPHALGYVCNNRCEGGCKRNGLNSPLSIRNLKRYAVEHDQEQIWKEKYLATKPRTGKKIAVIGGGATGLTAAFYLNKQGHDVTVFEKQKIGGGHMTGGMPEYRIPTKDVLAEIQVILDSGVKMECNHEIKNAAELKKDYDAVLVAVGTSVGKKLGYLPGANFDHVYTAVDLLRAQRLGLPIELGETVSIIGGGNVAFDVAGTLIRMGKTVNVVCLEKNASQASPEERDLALEEGANLFDCHSNEAIVGTQEKVTGLQVHKINSFYFHPETRALVEDAIPNSTYVIPCDSIVFAAGQVTGLTEEFGIELNRFGYPIDPKTGKSEFTTSVEGVFAAGDAITGTRFVIDAIASARQCAQLMDKYLGGDGNIDEVLYERELNPEIGKIEGFAHLERQEMTLKSVEERKDNFEPIFTGLTCDQATCEAGRCLQCDLRVQLKKPKMWTAYVK